MGGKSMKPPTPPENVDRYIGWGACLPSGKFFAILGIITGVLYFGALVWLAIIAWGIHA